MAASRPFSVVSALHSAESEPAKHDDPLGNVARPHGKNPFIFRGLKFKRSKCGSIGECGIRALRPCKPQTKLVEKMTTSPEPGSF
jgi:hypothetical protein